MPNNRLADLRNKSKLERYDLAAKLRVSEATIGHWERTGDIPRDQLITLADEFGVSIDWILGREADEDLEPAA